MQSKTLYKISIFANMIGRSVWTIRQWEKIGVLPITPFKGKNGHRYYTMEMILEMKKLLENRGRIEDLDSFKKQVYDVWKNIGVKN